MHSCCKGVFHLWEKAPDGVSNFAYLEYKKREIGCGDNQELPGYFIVTIRLND